MLNIAAHRRGFWELVSLMVRFTIWPHSVAVAPYLPRARVNQGARTNRGVPTGCGCGARADFSVTPRLGPITVLCFDPQPLHLIPECSGVKEWKREKSGIPRDIWGHVLQVWVGCARSGRTSGGSTRRGCDHGLEVGDAAARSASVGLLHPHGQNQNFKVVLLNKVKVCFYGNYKLACTVFIFK